jgi:hypothetical protein
LQHTVVINQVIRLICPDTCIDPSSSSSFPSSSQPTSVKTAQRMNCKDNRRVMVPSTLRFGIPPYARPMVNHGTTFAPLDGRCGTLSVVVVACVIHASLVPSPPSLSPTKRRQVRAQYEGHYDLHIKRETRLTVSSSLQMTGTGRCRPCSVRRPRCDVR